MTFTFYFDPGHGWLQVSPAELADVGMCAADFSRYSYRQGNEYFYLEEDCDAPKFLTRWEAKHGKASVRENENGAFIRALPHINRGDSQAPWKGGASDFATYAKH